MLTRELILNAFGALSDELRCRGVCGEAILVGGAIQVLVHQSRAATKDVNAIAMSPTALLRDAAAAVGPKLGLPADWLNDRARVFAAEVSVGDIVFATDHLVIRVASTEQLFGMKLSAMRDSVDYSDARTLLAALRGDREEVWRRVEVFLDPGQTDWKRQNFEALWRELHGNP